MVGDARVQELAARPLGAGAEIPVPRTGYRDPALRVHRIEMKGRRRGQPVRRTTNESYRGQQLGETCWLYVAWDALDNPDSTSLKVQDPAKYLAYAKKEVGAAPCDDFPAHAVDAAARGQARARE